MTALDNSKMLELINETLTKFVETAPEVSERDQEILAKVMQLLENNPITTNAKQHLIVTLFAELEIELAMKNKKMRKHS